MGLYKKNVEKTLNSRESLEKQREIVPAGNYLVTRVFPPSKYPTATLCTPYFRVYVPKSAWMTIFEYLKKDMASPLYIIWDGTEYEVEQDTQQVFGYSPYEKDEWGLRLPDVPLDDSYLAFEDFYAQAGEVPNSNGGEKPWF